MDIFLHGLIGAALKRKSNLWLAIFFSVLPDLIGLGGLLTWKPYNFSHSIFALLLILIIVILLKQKLELVTFYAIHIFLDVPFHATGSGNLFFSFKDPINYIGINWWEVWWIEAIIYIIILIVIFIRYKKGNYKINKNDSSK